MTMMKCACRIRNATLLAQHQRRYMAVYAMGDGWTGALGTGSLTLAFPGHDDEYEEEELLDAPVCVYSGNVSSAAAGWGHSALVTSHDHPQLLVCGRPHDFSTLLRLKRLPAFVRNYAVHHALRYNETGQQADTMAGKVVSWMMGSEDGPEGPWSDAKRNSILPEYIPMSMPRDQVVPAHVVASAGLTAVLSTTGGLYTFGLNHHGQCGVGKMNNNIWMPESPVVGLSSQFADEGRALLEQEYPIQSVALGLQHGIALDTEGNVFVWGKGERGQLGIQEQTTLECASRVIKWRLPSKDGRQHWASDLVVTKIAAGLSHTAALTQDNLVFVWGKNVAEPIAQEDMGKPAVDALAPIVIRGLPANKTVLDIACGSHHTAVLLEDGSVWAVGIATDTSVPIFEAVELIPPGMVDMPCSFFGAHFDRTTVIGNDGTQVLQVNLWSDEDLREQAVFTPAWMDHFHDKRIQSVHRGWLHTLIVTKD